MSKAQSQFSLSFLLYVGIGALVMLLTDLAVPPAEALASRTFLHLSPMTSSAFLLAWGVTAIFWFRSQATEELAAGPPKGGALIFFVTGILFLWGVACYVKPVLSTDVNLYIGMGRQIVVYGQSPYLLPLDATLPDAFLFQMAKGWLDNTSPYGPLALGLFALVCLVPLPSLLAYIVAMKIAMATFLLGIGAVLWWSLDKDRLRFTKTVAVIANPVVIWYAVVDCHVDVMLLFFFLLSVELARRNRPVLAAVSFACACVVKIFAILVSPVIFFWIASRSHRNAVWYASVYGLIFGAVSFFSGNGELAILAEYNPNSMSRAGIVPALLWGLGSSIPTAKTLSFCVLALVFSGLCVAVYLGWFPKELGIPVALVTVAYVFTGLFWQPWYTLQYWPLLALVAREVRTHEIIVGAWLVCMPFYHANTSFREVLFAIVTLAVVRLAIKDSGGVRGEP